MQSHPCPVCDGESQIGFLDRKRVPIHQNFVFPDRSAARQAPTGDLDMRVCVDCGFVFNHAFDPELMVYGEGYDNTQSSSAFFEAYMDDLVADLVENRGVRDCTIVEVGCGRGQFLRKLVEYPGAGNRGHGFDPSYVGPSSDLDGRIRFHNRYYDETCADVAADVVVSRHVIEHVPEPRALLSAVRAALARSPQAHVFFETPCVEWILRNRVIWDFFYEHCSLFSADSLATVFERSGFDVAKVDHVFGGQYLWLEARVGPMGPKPARGAAGLAELARAYGAAEKDLLRIWTERLQGLAARGPVALWGAGAKGATFANLVDSDCRLIDCVVDLNPNKQGCHIPGTGHPIISPNDLPRRQVHSAVLMNPNYRDENIRLLSAGGIEIDLVDWSM